MELTFLGAAREVTGSMLRIDTAGGALLVDCGMFQGRRAESRARNRHLPAAALDVQAAILTHAHVDHSGNLPVLVRDGFRGVIHATPATRDLCAFMLRDSARIQEADAAYLNRRHADDPAWEPITPAYDEDDAIAAVARFQTISYHRPFQPIPGVTARFLDAGHILGSAQVVLDVTEGGATRRLVVSGDLGRRGLPILRDPEHPHGPVDDLVLESTYGDRRHADVARMHDDLARVVTATAARGGKILVPAFALGRTQELLLVLHELRRAGRLPPIPIHIDSPLAIDVTSVFRLHPECYDAEARRFLDAHGDIFAFDGVHVARTREESQAIDAASGPAIIIAASGMCEAGRVLHHLRHLVEDPRHTILVVGFMAQHTLGRRLAERRPRVRIWGVERALHAQVEVLDAFSAHADAADLAAHAAACAPRGRVFLVHGEPPAQDALRDTLVARGLAVEVPARGERFAL